VTFDWKFCAMSHQSAESFSTLARFGISAQAAYWRARMLFTFYERATPVAQERNPTRHTDGHAKTPICPQSRSSVIFPIKSSTDWWISPRTYKSSSSGRFFLCFA
jgi:hypothetical protein